MSEFKVSKFLGKGSYGSVSKVLRLTDNLEYAMKEVKIKSMNQKEREEAVNEIRLLASVHHPNVVQYHEAFVEDDKLCIVTEYCCEGDLQSLIARQKSKNKYFDEEYIWTLFGQMLLGLQAVHNLGILHRDLKSANIFLDTGDVVKIGDLGVAKLVKNTERGGLTRTQVGTPYYVAPEIWNAKPYDTKCDIWSLGVLLYELLTLRRPFEAQNMNELRSRVLQNNYKTVPTFYSKELQDIVKKMLVLDPAQRPTVNALLSMPAVTKKMSTALPETVRTALDSRAKATDAKVPVAKGKPVKSTIKVPRNLTQLHLPTPNYPAPARDENKEPDVVSTAAPLFGVPVKLPEISPKHFAPQPPAAHRGMMVGGAGAAGGMASVAAQQQLHHYAQRRHAPSMHAQGAQAVGAYPGASVAPSRQPTAPAGVPSGVAPRPPQYMRRVDPLRY